MFVVMIVVVDLVIGVNEVFVFVNVYGMVIVVFVVEEVVIFVILFFCVIKWLSKNKEFFDKMMIEILIKILSSFDWISILKFKVLLREKVKNGMIVGIILLNKFLRLWLRFLSI